ncbi:hypothetical protein K490DRAFT_45784 [Saccharata proteae CBS 121410]|uniref:Nudix hydrolase domain-containing protein n=1 Tax=Saccharata proteae CBS 121410 TaxID=1314787 RepID=A0A9P4HV36_9PEZI|nr:hypothetical protein K490DRAFT_45784 [Saccharata proteae CBS 121410]
MSPPSTNTGETPPTALPQQLHSLLLDLSAHPYPHVPNPPGLKKRASVALIIRIQPRYSHWPSDDTADNNNNDNTTTTESFHNIDAEAENSDKAAKSSTADRLTAFFAQDWVRNGDPEVLFIKRAHRAGDRWTAHVALPGGRRDPEDVDDRAAAVRETWEEVGIKLEEDGENGGGNCIAVGNLPERVVTTSWGKVPLMVLHPHIFILTTPSPPPLRLQPTEVASCHWVSLRALLSPAHRTHWHEDVSNRLAKQEMGLKRAFLRLMLGKMVFAAINLVPSSSAYCSTIPGFVAGDDTTAPPSISTTVLASLAALSPSQPSHQSPHPPLLLWGLTLGIMADFLDLLPPHSALKLWTYPTFSPPDVRLALWLTSYTFRRGRERELGFRSDNDAAAKSSDVQVEKVEEGLDGAPPAGISGLGVKQYYGGRLGRKRRVESSKVGILLEGYYDIVRWTVKLVVAGRLAVAGAVVVWAVRWWRRGGGKGLW